MSRTDKDKPWKIRQAQTPQALLEPFHSCESYGHYTLGEPILDKDGNKQYRTEEKITKYETYSAYEKAVDEPRPRLQIPRRQPNQTHNKSVWVERGKRTYFNYEVDYICVREKVQVLIREPNYSVPHECTINEPKTKENDWGWNLSCSYEPVFLKTGGSPFTRARKKRQNTKNRQIGKKETKALVKNLYAGVVDLEDIALTNFVTRKRNDWG